MCDHRPMIYIVTNAIAILGATLCGRMFGLIYDRLAGTGRALPSAPSGTMGVVFLAELWLCAILAGALILAPPKGGIWTMTLGSAFVIWIGFVLPTIVAGYRSRGLGWRVIGSDCGQALGVMLVQAAVLRLIGLVAPAG